MSIVKRASFLLAGIALFSAGILGVTFTATADEDDSGENAAVQSASDALRALIDGTAVTLPDAVLEQIEQAIAQIESAQEQAANTASSSSNTTTQTTQTSALTETAQQAVEAVIEAVENKNSVTVTSSSAGNTGGLSATSAPVTQTSTSGNASASVTTEVKESTEKGISFNFAMTCTEGGNCASSQGSAVAMNGQGIAQGTSTASAGSSGKASATTSAVAGQACTGNGLFYSNVTNPDGSSTRTLSFSTGAACASGEVAAED